MCEPLPHPPGKALDGSGRYREALGGPGNYCVGILPRRGVLWVLLTACGTVLRENAGPVGTACGKLQSLW